jgi:membrane dipeptidase
MPLLVDAHQDLAWNATTFGRDYTQSALARRRAEQDTPTPERNGHSLLGLPEYRAGQVAVIFGALYVSPANRALGAWDTQTYTTAADAHHLYSAQLDYYRKLTENTGDFVLIASQTDLDKVLAAWLNAGEAQRPIGLVPLMEGADGIREPAEAEWWMARGVRIIGPAWSATRYAGGTGAPGPLTADGRQLLRHMADLGLILDLAHASDESYLQALDQFDGTVLVSHANPRVFMNGTPIPERFLSDAMIRRLAEKQGVIGLAPYNRFLKYGWQATDPRLPLTTVVAAIDYVCQLTGSAQHVALGTDFDGGFGVERVPAEIDTIADLQKLAPLLRERGYTAPDIAAIFSQNWIDLLRRGLPA